MKKVQNADFKEDRERKELLGDTIALAMRAKNEPVKTCRLLLSSIAIYVQQIKALEAENRRLKALLGVDEEDDE